MKRQRIKIIFDIVMAVILIMLMIYSLTGAFWHEAVGLVLMGLFIIHIGYNIPMLKRTIPLMFSKGHVMITFKYLLDIALVFFGFFTGISGILISRDILVNITVTDVALWVWLHNWAAYIALALISVHIGLHWKMMVAVITKPFNSLIKNSQTKLVFKIIWNLAAIGIIVYGFIANVNYKIPSYTNSSNTTLKNGTSGNASDDSSITTTSTVTADNTTGTLEEYLGNMICTACSKQCSLLSPQCSRGTEQATVAEQEWYSLQDSQSQDVQNSEDSQDTNNDSTTETPNTDSIDDSNNSQNTSLNEYKGSLKNNFGNILPIMGMYVGGTFYVTKLTSRRKNKNKH